MLLICRYQMHSAVIHLHNSGNRSDNISRYDEELSQQGISEGGSHLFPGVGYSPRALALGPSRLLDQPYEYINCRLQCIIKNSFLSPSNLEPLTTRWLNVDMAPYATVPNLLPSIVRNSFRCRCKPKPLCVTNSGTCVSPSSM